MKSSIEIKSSADPLKTDRLAIAVRCAIVFLASVLLANARILNSISGFGVSFAAALSPVYAVASILGSLAGYLLFGTMSENLVYIAALFFVFAVKLFLSRSTIRKAPPALFGAISLVAMLAAGIILSVIEHSPTMLVILRILQAMIAFAVTFFCCMAFKAALSGRKIGSYTKKEYYCFAMVAIMFLIALCDIHIGTMFSLGRTAALLLILIFVYRGGYLGGLVCAVISAVAVGLYSSNYAMLGGLMIVAAFFSGIFSRFGRLPLTAVFIVTNTCGMFLIGAQQNQIAYMFDVFAASVIFMILPERFSRFASLIPQQDSKISAASSQYSALLSSKLNFAAGTIDDLRGSLETVSKKMNDICANNISTVYDKTAEDVCKHCGMKMFCWETAYSNTMDAFNSLTQTLRQQGAVSMETMPQYFQVKCCKLSDLTMMTNFYYQEFLSRESANRKVNEAKLVATEQFEGIADMLCEIGDELGEVARFDDSAVKKVREVLAGAGIHAEEVCCLIDKNGRMCIEIYLEEAITFRKNTLSEQLSSALEREFDIPSVMTAGNKIKLAFFEIANYSVDFCCHQIHAENDNYCGDSYEYFLDSRGFAYLILSDGMGSGGRAAVDSTMTCSFILKLIKAGFGFESAIKLINSSLLVKAPDESLATIDIAKLDLYTGEAEFLKAGATASYVLKDRSVAKIESTSFPVGILKGAKFDRFQMKLSDHDIVVLVSDGVTATGMDWVGSELELGAKKSAKELAVRIAKEAQRRRIDGHSDDITVMVAKMSAD